MAFFPGSKYSYFVVLAADMVAFIAGTSITWSSPVLAILKGHDLSKNPLGRQISDDELSWIGSLAAIGGIIGPFIFGYLVQTLGRKLTMITMAFPFLVAYLIAAFAQVVELYYVSRILMGIGVGGAFCILPIFIVETVEDVNRGLLQASGTSCIKLGFLFSFCVGPYVSIMTFNLILSAICVLHIPIFWYVAPETPYYLISINKEKDAFKSLSYLRRKPNNEIQKEIEDIKFHLARLQAGSLLDIFKAKGPMKAFSYSVALTTFQQWSGVTVILYYTQNIFDATGSSIPSDVSSIIIGSAHLVVSIISVPFLDRAGRKILLLISVTGAILAEILLGVYFYLQKDGFDVSNIDWLPIVSLVTFIGFYNFGIGSIPWAVMSETLPLNIISKAAVIITSFYWFTGFFLTKYFGALSKEIGMAGSFWLFAGFCVLFDLFVYFFMFETKGKSLIEIQAILNS